MDSDLLIHCEVQGYPQPTVTWYKDNNPILPTDRVSITGTLLKSITKLSEINAYFVLLQNVGNNSLIITGAEGSDSGSYRCEAVNLLGDSTSVISVVVEGNTKNNPLDY